MVIPVLVYDGEEEANFEFISQSDYIIKINPNNENYGNNKQF